MMSDQKHTPGPWIIRDQDIIGHEMNGYICTWSGRPADAKLIAAAPDLLAACKAVDNDLWSYIRNYESSFPHGESVSRMYKAAKSLQAAIKKATP